MTDDVVAIRSPLGALDPNVPLPVKPSIPSSSLDVKFKENVPTVLPSPSVRDRLLARKARSPVISGPPDSGVFIDLTGSDDETSIVPTPVSNLISDYKPSILQKPVIPWKMGPVPPLILSSKVINGEKITSFAQLKYLASKASPPPPVTPMVASTSKTPPCPDLDDFISNAQSADISLSGPTPQKLPRLSLPSSVPGPSGLPVVPIDNKPISIDDLYSDDDEPLDSLLPNRNRLTYARRTSGKPLPKATTAKPDPCDRIPSRRKRGKSPH